MSMRNPKAEHVDFGFLEGIIPENPKWSACNVDMAYHRSNKDRTRDSFLFVEWKNEGEEILPGQKYLLKALSGLPNTIVLIVIGHSKPNDVQVDKIYKVHKNGRTELTTKEGQSGIDNLKSLVTIWYDWASK